jgi:acid phosphatase (class A)
MKLNTAHPPALLPRKNHRDYTRGLHSPTGVRLARRCPNFTLETPRQAAGNISISTRTIALLFAGALCLLSAAAPLRAAGPYLHGFDPIALLPPPPPLGTAEDVADRESTLRIYTARTPAEVALGKSEHTVTIFAFTSTIGPFFRPGKFPQTEALFAEVEAETKKIVNTAKNTWKRPRPFVADPARFAEPGDPEKSPGYPSGHSTRGTVFALLLAEIFPERREAILAKGRNIGWTRVEIGVHTPLDIYGGRVLGQALAREFLHSPAFQADLAAARAEIAAETMHSSPP